MKKSDITEMEAVIANMRVFILQMHDFAGLPIPEDFDPEIAAINCRDALYAKHKATLPSDNT